MGISINNFYLGTKARFKGCKIPKRKPNYISYSKKYPDEVSSVYYYGTDSKGDYIIRVSDHWSTLKEFNSGKAKMGCKSIASCWWDLKTTSTDKTRAGKAYIKDFSIIL